MPVRMIDRPVMAWMSVNEARSFFAMMRGRGSITACPEEYIGSTASGDFSFISEPVELSPSELTTDVRTSFSCGAVIGSVLHSTDRLRQNPGNFPRDFARFFAHVEINIPGCSVPTLSGDSFFALS